MSETVIAVGFDGSVDSGSAASWAARLALDLGARVVLVRAKGLLDRFEGEDVEGETARACIELSEATHLDLERISARVVEGDPLDTLLAVGDDPLHASMLVVGTRGAGKHSGLLLGSTSLQLAERAEIPLVIVPTT